MRMMRSSQPLLISFLFISEPARYGSHARGKNPNREEYRHCINNNCADAYKCKRATETQKREKTKGANDFIENSLVTKSLHGQLKAECLRL